MYPVRVITMKYHHATKCAPLNIDYALFKFKCRNFMCQGGEFITQDIFLIGIMGGGVQLGPLGTAATNRSIVPAPADYDNGEIGGMIGGGNRSA
jgi:hypothetical protein